MESELDCSTFSATLNTPAINKRSSLAKTIRRSLSNKTIDKPSKLKQLASKQNTATTLSSPKEKTSSRPKSALPPYKAPSLSSQTRLTSSTAGDLINPLTLNLDIKPVFQSNDKDSSDDLSNVSPTLPSVTITSEASSETSSPSKLNSSSAVHLPSTIPISPSEDVTEDNGSLDITAFLAAPRLTQRVRLKTGRVVSFSEVGDRNGFPVFVFLGMGCVRYFIAFFDDLASSYGLRLICPDRPGVGLSDDVKVEDQQVLKWPEVIEELCEILGIEKFFIMAHSAGAPYALSCAVKIPERLQGTIYLVCPWVSTTIANNFKWLRFVPTPIMKFTNSAGISLQQMLHGRQPYSTKPSKNPSALSQMSSLERKQQLGLAILKASFSENLTGANNDLLMCFERRHSFGFSYADINHPVHVFHGTKDERIPVAAVKWMEESMPNCGLTLIEGGKHSLLLRAEIVDTIFKAIALQLHVKDACRVCRISSRCWLMEEAENSQKQKEDI
ncbi:3901_t:CDS:2 [Acaulospora morrowiae]|uniref:3901_t:CDS:1 n=1 Tax=Acaulospora morrowiae TaxID=94023 RepID=A0A9N9BJW0_9GLOM|nr:3901_t:CDS:2 [Acaulospora morrowiae]